MTSTQQESCGERRTMIESLQIHFLMLRSLLSVRAKNILNFYKLTDAENVIKKLSNYDKIIILKNCGRITATELYEMVCKLKDYARSLNTIDEDVVKPTAGIQDIHNDSVEKLLNTNLTNTQLSNRAYNCLRRAKINTIGKLVALTKEELYSIKNLGERTVIELEEFIKLQGLHFANNQDEVAIRKELISEELQYINSLNITYVEKEFSIHFKKKNGHFPMLFLLNSEISHMQKRGRTVINMLYGLKESYLSHSTLDNQSLELALPYCSGNKFFTIKEIASELGYSLEGTKQLILRAQYLIRNTVIKLHLHPDWHLYLEEGLPPVIFDTIPFATQLVSLEEAELNAYLTNYMTTIYPPYTIAYSRQPNIVFFLYLGMMPYWIDYMRKKISPDCPKNSLHEPAFFANEMVESFDINKAIREIDRLCGVKTKTDILIPINAYFIENSYYWKKKPHISDSETKTFYNLLVYLVQKLFGVPIENGNLVIKANTYDYSDILYEILKKTKRRLHRDYLFERLKNICLEKNIPFKLSSSSQITTYLTRDKRIVSIGKSSMWGLLEWGETVGSIREIAMDLVKKSKLPIQINELTQLVLTTRPDSNERSILAVIRQTASSGDLILFYGDYIGYPNANYKDEYIIMPQNFDKWLQEFRKFVLTQKRYPTSGNGFEGYLYRWHYKASQLTELTADEILRFDALEKELSHYPHNAAEYNFLHNCELYMRFVERNNRKLKVDDNSTLYNWFYVASRNFSTYNDNRGKYFSQLLQFLSSKLY